VFVLRPIPHHFLIWALLAPLLLLEFYTLESLLRVIALQDARQSRVALARVVEMRPGSRGVEIRYHFSPPGSDATYYARGAFGRSSLWIPLSDAAWQAAQRRGGLVEVRYLPSDPWTNQPVGRIGNPVADSFCLWGLFLVFDLVWLAETFVIGRNFVHCTAMVERRVPHRARFWESRRVPDRRLGLGNW
jgi:hypothetical protein